DADPTRRGPVSRGKSAVLRSMILAMANQNKFDEANKMIDKLLQASPDNWLVLELRGRVQLKAGREADAAKTFEEVISLINKEKEIKDDDKAELTEDSHYLLSSLYVELNQIDKAIEH